MWPSTPMWAAHLRHRVAPSATSRAVLQPRRRAMVCCAPGCRRGAAQSRSCLGGLEATGPLWEPLYEHLTQRGYQVLLLNPRQTASWAARLGRRAKTDGIDAQTLAAGLLAGLARASTLPSETVQALRTLTRARRDRIHGRTATRQRLHDELVTLFPEFVRFLPTLPGRTDLGVGDPAVLDLLSTDSSAHALAQVPLQELTTTLERVSGGRWMREQAQALQDLAQHSTASPRAVTARSLVARLLAQQLQELAVHLAEVEAAIAPLLKDDVEGQRLQALPGIGRIGPPTAATIRAELGDVMRCGIGRRDALRTR